MVRPRIGVTLGRDLPERPGFLRVRPDYLEAVARAGGIPIVVPPLADPAALDALLALLDGVLVSGGLDLDPRHYGESPHPTTRVDEVRDALELAVVQWALDAARPTLGICRGQQLLNVALGGSLIQDLESEGKQHWQAEDWSVPTHAIVIEPGSHLGRVLGTDWLDVNSFHHQAVRTLGAGLVAVARAPDGVIEAIEHETHPWMLAVQFHPENLLDPRVQRLFGSFVEACRTAMTERPANSTLAAL